MPNSRILIFGAGVIGSVYAIKFIEAGLDVTLFARGSKYDALKEYGIRYLKKGVVKSVPVNVINALADDDVYDYIFAAVRYDQAISALTALKENRSPNIITMTNNSGDFAEWQDIIGKRLILGFPAAGGQIVDGILHPMFPPKAIMTTMLGEVDGKVTPRINALAELFKCAKLPLTVEPNMPAYLITHSVMNIAMTGVLHSGGKVMDGKTAESKATAHKITTALKSYLRAIQNMGIPITPSAFKVLINCPSILIDLLFMILLRTKMVKDIMLSDYAGGATNEIVELERDFLRIIK